MVRNLVLVKVSHQHSLGPPAGNGVDSFGQNGSDFGARFLSEFDLFLRHQLVELALARRAVFCRKIEIVNRLSFVRFLRERK
jgi:hypothetical protein